VREKLRFPLNFEKKSFCLDFASVGGSSTSDCEPTSLSLYRQSARSKANFSASGKQKQALKKKFSSAEKVKRRPLRQALLSPSELTEEFCHVDQLSQFDYNASVAPQILF